MDLPEDIIKLNNEKREQLTEVNSDYYEDMLVYIRLSSAKSEQYTEELLLELLEHLLQAQEEGRTAEEVFGSNPKEYCNELIGEIPRETRRKQLHFSTYIILYFLAIISFMNGIVGSGMYYFFKLGSNTITFSIGSGIIIIIINLLILYLMITIIFKWLKTSIFKRKKTNKWLEFLQLWGMGVLYIGLFVILFMFMPEFGTSFTIPTISLAGLGVLLFITSYILKKR